MRVIEHQMLQAIQQRKNWKKSNTEVRILSSDMPHITVLLYDNEIYEQCANKVGWSLCRRNTTTTRSRLRSLGIPIHQRKGLPYLIVGNDMVPIASNKRYIRGEEINGQIIVRS